MAPSPWTLRRWASLQPAAARPGRPSAAPGVMPRSQGRVLLRGTCPAAASSARSSPQLRRGPSSGAAAPPPRSPLLQHRRQQQQQQRRSRHVPASSAASTLVPLGMDFLTFLSATVLVVPLCKQLKISPVLGFLASGVILQQLGLLKDLKDVELLSELGVLFLLFEQGLELSLDRLKALAKFAFGMGTLQVVATTLIFTGFALPAGRSWGTTFLEVVAHAPPSLVSIRTVDEAVVIGAALAMSSSAFVLQLLQERGELPTRVGSATLGILLFQDIAVVPFLVLLPVIEMSGGMEGASPANLLQMLGPTALQTLAGLGALLLGGRVVLRRIFEMVANSRSSETFVALCLLTVGGTSLITKQLGLSDTLGAFIAGVLLSETSFRTQIEADIRPFRGLLIGLFFLSVGSSINMEVLRDNYDIIAYMLVGLVSLKAAVNIFLGPLFGLSKSESIRTGFLLSQGGEFAFVLLSLACQLKLLPNDLNQILIITVVCSMALTPALAQLGQALGDLVEAQGGGASASEALGQRGAEAAEAEDPVVILGFGPQGQMVANMIGSPLARTGSTRPLTYLAFDLEHAVVRASRLAGFNILYGDGSRPDVLRAAGVKRPRAIAVCYSAPRQVTKAVQLLAESFPGVPLYAVASSFAHATDLRGAGAQQVCITGSEAGLNLGASVLSQLGTGEADIQALKRGIGEAIAVRTQACAVLKAERQEAATSAGGSGAVAGGVTAPVSSNGKVAAAAAAAGGSSSSPAPAPSADSSVEVFALEGRWCCATVPEAGGAMSGAVLAIPTGEPPAPGVVDDALVPSVSSSSGSGGSGSSSSSSLQPSIPNGRGRSGSGGSSGAAWQSGSRGTLLGVAVEEDMNGVWAMEDADSSSSSSSSSGSGGGRVGPGQGVLLPDAAPMPEPVVVGSHSSTDDSR